MKSQSPSRTASIQSTLGQRKNSLARAIAALAIPVCLSTVTAQAQPIWSNTITGTNPNTSNPYTTGQVVDANITVSGIGRGSGIAGANANNRYNANGWSTTTLDVNDYFYFTLTPASGYEIDFTSFVYTGQVSSGTPTVAFRSSLDFTTNIGTAAVTGTTISLSGAAYQNITSSIEFRYYGFGLAAGTTTLSINDFTFNGTVSLTGGASGNYWVGGDTTLGGSGTWAASGGTSWRTTDTDGAGTTFDATQLVNFGGSAGGNVTVSGTVAPTKGITFGTTGYELNGGTLNLAGTSSANNTITTAAGVSAKIASDITGSNGLIKAGAGNLTLSSASNSFVGNVTVNGGTLEITSDGALGNTANDLAISGATLKTGTSISLDVGRDLSGSGSIAVSNGQTLTLNGNLTGTTLAFTDSGSLALGGITNSASSLSFSAPGSLSGTALTLNGGITTSAYSGNASVGNNLNFGSSDRTLALEGNLQLSGNLSLAASRRLINSLRRSIRQPRRHSTRCSSCDADRRRNYNRLS
jgi:autotransporter-associated beta strand protein